jgi:hypothetical protein
VTHASKMAKMAKVIRVMNFMEDAHTQTAT